jgi:hypothetical protein
VVPEVTRRLITDAVLARLQTLTGVAVYRGEVVDHPPALANDPDGRVGPYVILYPFGGTPGPEVDLGDTTVDLVYSCQVTCAAGYSTDCEYLTDRVHPLLFRWAPTVTGLVCGPLRPPPGFDPGPVRRDDQPLPPRFYVPLQFRSIVTT